jgi:hypothetical protein
MPITTRIESAASARTLGSAGVIVPVPSDEDHRQNSRLLCGARCGNGWRDAWAKQELGVRWGNSWRVQNQTFQHWTGLQAGRRHRSSTVTSGTGNCPQAARTDSESGAIRIGATFGDHCGSDKEMRW